MIPTIEQCKQFKRLVDKGRAATGQEPIEFLEFDKCKPDCSDNCLSANNLFHDAGYSVGNTEFSSGNTNEGHDELPKALEAEGGLYFCDYIIPEAIKVVTDPFDKNEPGLRERLVEAGVVAP